MGDTKEKALQAGPLSLIKNCYYFLAAFLRLRLAGALAFDLAALRLAGLRLAFLATVAFLALRTLRALVTLVLPAALRRDFGFAAFTTLLLLLAMTSFLPIVNNINLTLSFIKV